MKVKIKTKPFEELTCGGTEGILKYAVITNMSNQVIATLATYEMAHAFINGWVRFLNGTTDSPVTTVDRFSIAEVYLGDSDA